MIEYSNRHLISDAIKYSFWYIYDYLGKLFLINIFWLLLSLPIITIPLANAGLFYATSRSPLELNDFIIGIRRFAKCNYIWFLFSGLVIFILSSNLYFYYIYEHNWGIFAAFLGGLELWLLLCFLNLQIYALPLLISDDGRLIKILKSSILLFGDNISFSLSIFLYTFISIVICFLSGAGMILIVASGLGVLWNISYKSLKRKYNPDIFFAEENRTLKNVFKPWED